MHGAVGGRYQRRSRDVANDANLDLSTLVPGGLVRDQSDRVTRGRAVADLMGSWFRYDPKLVGKTPLVAAFVDKVALRNASIKSE